MKIERIKEVINEVISPLTIDEQNKQFYRGAIIAILGEKFSYRAEYDESLFGKLVDEAIDEKIDSISQEKSK